MAKEVLYIEYDPSEWRLFIDSSKTSLEAVLLHNSNSFALLPLGHSMRLEKNYNNDLSMILEKINYQEHRCMVCGDLKMLTVSLETMGNKEKEAWDTFKDVVHRVLENAKDPLYKTIVQRMLTAYEAQGCKMSLKVHFLHSHIVKSRVEDFTRMSVISRRYTKEDGTSTC
ncbi:hypothetical protein AVEN_148087-1 [Araneus ventricosus]|uniref:Uncharacterized protein n=1 Tax=Araneus ventricosus TaxID=182803 RepID=A0A4Y2G7E2_ARAVE|nr:hypothetical protein AVEN_148087-1 [Araneus ventricosus]